MEVKYEGKIYKVRCVDFDGIMIRRGCPSVIIKENDGCIPLSVCEIIYPKNVSQQKQLTHICNHVLNNHYCFSKEQLFGMFNEIRRIIND